MRILVTGASGLLGLNIALEAVREHTVYGLVNSHPIKTDEQQLKAFHTIQADLLDSGTIERLINETEPDWIIHCAALADIDACETDPDRARQINTEIPRKLASIVARGGARMLHVSTDAIFDGRTGNYIETDTPNPLSVYAQTKLDGEYAVINANPDAIIARVNLYGWSLSGKRSLAEFFFNNLSSEKKIFGFTDVFFCPLLANDLAHIFFEMLQADLKGLYHVVSSECVSKYEFGVRIAKKFGLDEQLISPNSVAESGLRATRSTNLTLCINKLSEALGKPVDKVSPNISTGIDRFYTLYQQDYPQFIRELGV